MTPEEAARFPVGCRVRIVYKEYKRDVCGVVTKHRGDDEDFPVHVHVVDDTGTTSSWEYASSLKRIDVLPAPEEIATAIDNLDKILEEVDLL